MDLFPRHVFRMGSNAVYIMYIVLLRGRGWVLIWEWPKGTSKKTSCHHPPQVLLTLGPLLQQPRRKCRRRKELLWCHLASFARSRRVGLKQCAAVPRGVRECPSSHRSSQRMKRCVHVASPMRCTAYTVLLVMQWCMSVNTTFILITTFISCALSIGHILLLNWRAALHDGLCGGNREHMEVPSHRCQQCRWGRYVL